MNIFGGVEPPRWLQEAARPASGKELGQFLGDQMSILALAMQRDPNAPKESSWWESRRGIADAQTDVQNSKIDPMWKQNRDIKLGQWALQTQSKILQNDLVKERLDASTRLAQDEAEDQATFSKAMADVGTDTKALLNYPMPAFKSAKYGTRWVQAKAGASASLDGIEEKQRIISDVKLAVSDHNAVRDGLSQLDPTQRAAIGEPKGKNGTYTAQQIFAVNDMLKAEGKPTIGQKQYKPALVIELTRNLQEAEAAGDTELAETLRAAITKATASKPLSTVGKLEYDKAAAIKAGATPEVLRVYDDALQKSSQTASGIYAKDIEVLNIEGHKFLRVGKQLRNLDSLTVAQKAIMDMAKSRVNRLETALLKSPLDSKGNPTAERQAIMGQLAAARKVFDRAISPAPVIISPTATGTNSPSSTVAPPTKAGRFTVIQE